MTSDRRELQKSLRTDLSPSMRVRLSRARSKLAWLPHLPGALLGHDLDRPIFVVGAPRSGTSLLFRILATSNQVAHYPGEAHEIWERDHHPALRGWDSNVLTASDLDDAGRRRIRRSFYLVAGSSKRLIDKTPRNSFRIGFVDALFPDARYVFLQRDGRDNVNSLMTAWKTPRYRTYKLPEPHGIPGVPDPTWWKFVLYPGWKQDLRGPLEVVCANQWVHSNEIALTDLAAISSGRWTTTRYEDLVADPANEVTRLARFLELGVDDRLMSETARLVATPINVVTPPESDKWRKENPTEIEAIAPRIGATMAKLGYPVT